MSSKSEKDRAKQIQDKCQSLLTSMLRDEDNKYCVDCDSKGPRWASWNLGVFLCIRCAGIHRNLGVHISRVKSVNLDTWTPEQVVSLQQMGNSRARAVYEALLPDGFRRPQTDSSLEAFVRAKYEQKKYLAREWVQPPPPKVDWDKEIDEELEKQKKKKKGTTSSLSNVNSVSSPKPKSDAIPQLLPKPNAKVNASPVTGRSNERTKPSSASADLLGLDTKTSGFSEDFSGFLSAEPNKLAEQKQTESKNDSLKAEEESFFNQPAPTEKEKAKLTKDSILALYDTAPLNNTQFQNNSMAFGNFSAQNVSAYPQNHQPVHSNTFAGNQQVYPNGATNQFYPKNNFQQFNNQQQQFPLHQQLNAFQQVPTVQSQLHNFAAFPQNSNVPYMQSDALNFQQQNGGGFPLNSAFLQNTSNLVQSSYPQNNGLQMNGVNNSMNNAAFMSDPNFAQPNQYFGMQHMTQQFGNMSVNAQNQFGSAGNVWQ